MNILVRSRRRQFHGVRGCFSYLLAGLLACAVLAARADAGEPSKLQQMTARATAGDPSAQYALGLAYADGTEAPPDTTEAVRWLRAACESALPPAWRRGAFFLDLGYADPYAIQPVDQHGPAGGMNDPVPVNYNMAVQLSQGPGSGGHDFRQAAVYFRKAADDGYAPAQYNLALLCASGQGVDTNRAEALHLFLLAASRGAPRAMHAAGAALFLGRGVEADQSTAIAWFSKAAEAGDARALCCRGVLLLAGASSPDSAAAGLADVTTAAQAGNPVARYDLGVAHAEGRGTAQDFREALRWLRSAGAGLLADRDGPRGPVQFNATDSGAFAIYLLKDQSLGLSDARARALPDLILADEPFMTAADIVSYAWSDHTFEVTPAMQARMEALGRMPYMSSGLPFVVAVGPSRRYLGAFWWAYSSLMPTVPCIYVMPATAPLTLQRALGAVPGDSFDEREDALVRESLRAAGVLRN
jgi:TPR repeat protein